jgi:hypothetical protein
LLTTPSKDAPLYRMGLLTKFDNEVGHLRRYTQYDVELLLKNSGFKIIKKSKTEGIFRNLLYTNKFLGQLIRVIRGPFVSIFHFIDEISVKLFGESDLIFIAQKN